MSESGKRPHIAVCICTYRRQEWLARLLGHLGRQETQGVFTYSVVVADNDAAGSARVVVEEFRAGGAVEVAYGIEPEKNIAAIRNKSLEMARGEWVAFIDDDEFPVPDWLLRLYRAACDFEAAGVLGPVRPHFEEGAPEWARRSGLYDRREYETGHVLPWRETRTGNVLFRSDILDEETPAFDEQFGTGGEDQDFFRRMIEKGKVFVWCNEAVVHETVPPIRWDKKTMVKRALLRGKNTLRHSDRKALGLVKSLVAVAGYALALPVLALVGKHLYMRYLIKACDHLGKLAAFLGVNPVEERVG